MAVLMNSGSLQRLVTPIITQTVKSLYEQRTNETIGLIDEREGQPFEFHNITLLYGFANAPLKNPGEAISYDQGGVLYNINVYYQTRGLAFAVTEEMVEDGKANIDVITTFSRHLTQSMVETQEKDKANMINFGFNPNFIQNGGDGVPLFSSNHIGVGPNNNQSNILATPAVLSQTSMEQLLIQIRKARDPRGKYIGLKPEWLFVPPELQFQARVLLESVLRSDTANNSINSVNGFLKGYKVISRLTSPYAYVISTTGFQGDGLVLYHRGAPRPSAIAREGDFDTASLRFKTTMRYGQGWADWRAVFGSTGI